MVEFSTRSHQIEAEKDRPIVATCAQIIEDGGPGALHLIVLWSLTLGLAFLLTWLISVVLLIKARATEAIQWRGADRRIG